MTIFPVPGWAYFSISPITLPEVYWNAVSAEQRIKMLCEDLWKLVRQVDLIVQGLNELDDRLTIAEEKIEQILVRLGEITDELAIITGRLDVIDGQILALEGDIQRIDLVLTQHTTDISNIVSDIGDINGQLTIINQAIQDLPTTIQDQIDLYVQTSTFETIINNLVEADLSGKIDVIDPAVAGRIPLIDAAGQLEDSGYTPADFLAGGGGGIPPVVPAVAGNLPILKADGTLEDSGSPIPVVPDVSGLIPSVDPAVAGNVPILDADGNLTDSGSPLPVVPDVSGLMPKISPAAADAIPLQTAGGELTNSGAKILPTDQAPVTALWDSDDLARMGTVVSALAEAATSTAAFDSINRGWSRDAIFTAATTVSVEGATFTLKSARLAVTPGGGSSGSWTLLAVAVAGTPPQQYTLVAHGSSRSDLSDLAALSWQIISTPVLEAVDEIAAAALSLAVPNSIVYVPED